MMRSFHILILSLALFAFTAEARRRTPKTASVWGINSVQSVNRRNDFQSDQQSLPLTQLASRSRFVDRIHSVSAKYNNKATATMKDTKRQQP